MKNKTVRLEYLDAVRGIAALLVVVYHFIGWKWGDYTKYHLASLIFNGSDAVSFFFVLSGFVLSYKYFHSDVGINLPRFTYKRILRLYPAFIITIILNFLYWNRVNIMDGNILSVLQDIFLFDNKELVLEYTMVRNVHKYYIPGWTLGVEMALSLLMPFLILAGRKSVKILWWFLPICLFLGSYISMFMMHFVLGTLLAYYYDEAKSFSWKSWKFKRWNLVILMVTVIFFSIRHLDRMFPFPGGYQQIADLLKLDFFHFTGLASAIILLWIISNKKAQQLLEINPLKYLGKISYSVYLMHWIFVVFVMDYWDKFIGYFPNYYLGFGVLLVAVIIATLVSASALYHLVEKPFINLARRSKWFTNDKYTIN
jgi:peptidoglycan/LPS O-acetylase OafA/YrhL